MFWRLGGSTTPDLAALPAASDGEPPSGAGLERAAVQHLFFDLDGTLTDPAPGIVACLQHALSRMQRPVLPEAELRRFIGPPLRDAFREILGSDDGELVEEAVRRFRERFSTEGLYENQLYPGITAALAELHAAGLTLWVVTSKAQVYAERIAEHFGIRGYFRAVYGAELSGTRSLKAELIAHLLQQEQIAAASACMIGDRRHDIDGARAHAMTALGVLWGYGSRAELLAAGADAVVEVVGDLPAAIRALIAR